MVVFDKISQKNGKGRFTISSFLMENVVFLKFQCVKGTFFRCHGVFFFCVFEAPDFHHLFPFSCLSHLHLLSLSSSLLFSSPLRGIPLSLLWSFLFWLVSLSSFFLFFVSLLLLLLLRCCCCFCHRCSCCFCCWCVVAELLLVAVAARVAGGS